MLGDDRSGFEGAAAAARAAEVAIVVVAGKSGLHRPVTVGEANDAAYLELTGVQAELVDALAATGTPLVVVVLSGRVHALAGVATKASALIQLFPPGEEGGNGLADILTGAVSPSGRLPVTLPRSIGQIPVHRSYRAGGGQAMFFGDYVDSPTTPLFPFGHGSATRPSPMGGSRPTQAAPARRPSCRSRSATPARDRAWRWCSSICRTRSPRSRAPTSS